MSSIAQPMPLDITIAGETNLDLVLYGLPEELELERELLASQFKITLGGSSSILAHNLAILGTRVGFLSEVGDDEMADIALNRPGIFGGSNSEVDWSYDEQDDEQIQP